MAENSASAYAEGVPCWVDAQLPDVEAGKRFYGALFGWTFQEQRYGGAVWALKEGEPVAALAHKTDGRMPTVWTVYFSTPDIEGLADRLWAAGGQVVTAPVPVGDLGATALVTDPEGAVFGLWEPGTHRGFGVRHAPGAFAWAQLYTRDTEGANSFYGGLFHEALFGPDADPDFGRAPVTDVFPPEMPPHFVVHFGVEDLEAALGTVQRLGGRVQAPPFRTSYGIAAVVTDDQGASFALLRRPFLPLGATHTGTETGTGAPAAPGGTPERAAVEGPDAGPADGGRPGGAPGDGPGAPPGPGAGESAAGEPEGGGRGAGEPGPAGPGEESSGTGEGAGPPSGDGPGTGTAGGPGHGPADRPADHPADGPADGGPGEDGSGRSGRGR